MMFRLLSFAVIVAIVSVLCSQIDALLLTPPVTKSHRLQPFIGSKKQECQYRHHRKHIKISDRRTHCVHNGDTAETDELPIDDFKPLTMKVFESYQFFIRFTLQSIIEKHAQRSQGGSYRRRLRHRLKQLIFRRKHKLSPESDVVRENITATEPKKKKLGGIFGSLRKLAASRKNLTRLVGYDSSLLVPAFSYLILGALMSSVVPHFYSACISCVAAGEPNRSKLMWALIGLGSSQVAEALFTGFRGALFWIAGTLLVVVIERFCFDDTRYLP
jgi:hypothetical protein